MKFFALLLMAWSINAWADPLSEFESIVKGCRAAYDARPAVEVAYIESTKSWVKRAYTDAKITYDVLKTDSLVSPYRAYLEVLYVAAYKSAPDEDGAKALEVSIDENPIRFVNRVNYRYQGDTWDVADGTKRMDSRRDGLYGDRAPFEASRDVMLKQKPPFAGCIVAK